MTTAASLSTTDDADLAALEAADAVAAALDAPACSLAVVFVTPVHADALGDVGAAVSARLQPDVLLGAVAEGVAGPGREIESGAGVSVWAAALPGAETGGFRSWAVHRPDGQMAVAGWPDTEPGDVTILLADPFSYPAAQVTDHVSRARPGHPIIGGLVTGGRDTSRLLRDGQVHDDGAVGVVLRGARVHTLVSQGCRPVGKPFTVTGADGNVILELAGEPATERLQSLFEESDDGDRALMQRGLHVGFVADDYRDEFGTGDFLIRSVLGADEDRGGLAVGQSVEVGQVVQFQVRDAASAHADLIDHLDEHRQTAAGAADGALLFTCNGRGTNLFEDPGHDVGLIGQRLTPTVAGAFCAGEIGPVGERSFVHGFTASVAVFDQQGGDGASRDGA